MPPFNICGEFVNNFPCVFKCWFTLGILKFLAEVVDFSLHKCSVSGGAHSGLWAPC